MSLKRKTDENDLTKRKKKRRKTNNTGEPVKKNAEIGGFTILGQLKSKEKTKVHRVLPKWLRTPTVITADLLNNKLDISELHCLHPALVNNLRTNNITEFFPVQSIVIPWLIRESNGNYRANDICVSAPTGSGKTLAYALPLIQAFTERIVIEIRALVLLPTRDLAVQVYEVFSTYSINTGVKIGLAVGEKTFASEQFSLVRQNAYGTQSAVDIVIATPGRLVDHIQRTPGFKLNHLKYLVIDEADRMMEEVHQDWLKYIDQHIISNLSPTPAVSVPGIAKVQSNFPPISITPANISQWSLIPQKLLFSATLSQNPEKLEQLRLFQPKLFTSVVPSKLLVKNEEAQSHQFIGKYTTPAELTEYYIQCEQQLKPLILFYLLKRKKYYPALCFTNTLETTNRLYLLLKEMTDLNIEQMSSILLMNKRNKIIKKFEEGKIDVIIATDMMTRGMDFKNLDYVISYDKPFNMKQYIHRIGRTARAGRPGTAISLLLKKEVPKFQQFLTSSGKIDVENIEIAQEKLGKYEELYTLSLQKIKDIIVK